MGSLNSRHARAVEIRHKSSQRALTTGFQSQYLPVAQQPPSGGFSRRALFPELAEFRQITHELHTFAGRAAAKRPLTRPRSSAALSRKGRGL